MKAIIIIIIVLLVLFWLYLLCLRCRRGKMDQAYFRQWRYAHRGLHDREKGIPENSMAAFKRAAANGFGAELDVHLMKDGKLAVIHDASLLRTAGADVEIEDLTAEALERLELPVNIAAGVARIELLGNRELYMDRHRGVLAYTTEAVDVNGGGVVVRVRGQGLQLLVMTEQELRITGKISGIDLVE